MWTTKAVAEYDAYTLSIEIGESYYFAEITSNGVLEWFHTVSNNDYTLEEVKKMLIDVVDYRVNVYQWIGVNEVHLL